MLTPPETLLTDRPKLKILDNTLLMKNISRVQYIVCSVSKV